MKIDKYHDLSEFSQSERFFLSCWYNLVHESSLDSYRVRIMNPLNIAEELKQILTVSHSNNEDIFLVYDEFISIVEKDLFFKEKKDLKLILESIKKSIINKSKQPIGKYFKFEKNNIATISFIDELIINIHDSYIDFCIEWFIENLKNDLTREIKSNIRNQLNYFISFLIHKGYDIKTLVDYYNNILTRDKKKYYKKFIDRLRLLKRIISGKDDQRDIIFCICGNSKSDIDNFPIEFFNEITSINFFREITDIKTCLSSKEPIRELTEDNILKISSIFNRRDYQHKIYVLLSINGVDGKAAGFKAYQQLNSILDLIRFEFFERSLYISDSFAFLHTRKIIEHKINFSIPNPKDEFNLEGLKSFLGNFFWVLFNSNISESTNMHITSALQFYRYGKDSNNQLNKLTNWWTALEHLTSQKKIGSIGGCITENIPLILSKLYLSKHLSYIKKELVRFNIELKNEYGENVLLKEKSNADFFKILRDDFYKEQIVRHLNGIDDYISFCIDCFMEDILDDNKVFSVLSKHRDVIEKQLQRIYRTRCDIVHSSKSNINTSLLCSHLEYYLKVLFNQIILYFGERSYIKTLDEFFKREFVEFGDLFDESIKDKSILLEKLLTL